MNEENKLNNNNNNNNKENIGIEKNIEIIKNKNNNINEENNDKKNNIDEKINNYLNNNNNNNNDKNNNNNNDNNNNNNDNNNNNNNDNNNNNNKNNDDDNNNNNNNNIKINNLISITNKDNLNEFNITCQNKIYTKEQQNKIKSFMKSEKEKIPNKKIFDSINKKLNHSMRNIFSSNNITPLKNSKSYENFKQININNQNNNKNNLNKENSFTNLRLLKNLLQNSNELKKKIFSLTQNELMFKNLLSQNNNNNNDNDKINQTNYLVKYQKIIETKKKFSEQLTQIQSQIDNIIYEESKNEGIIKEKIKNDLLDLSISEKNIYYSNLKIKQLQKESLLRQQKIKNNLLKISLINEKQNFFDKMMKINEKKIFYQNFHEIEKKSISERHKKNSQKISELKLFLNANKKFNNDNNINKFEKNFLSKENEIYNKEMMHRKELMKKTNYNFFDFQKEFLLKKNIFENEQNEKTKQLKILWNERSKLIPKYISPFYKNLIENENNQNEMEKKKNEDNVNRKIKQINYSKTKVPKPKKNNSINERNFNNIKNINNKFNINNFNNSSNNTILNNHKSKSINVTNNNSLSNSLNNTSQNLIHKTFNKIRNIKFKKNNDKNIVSNLEKKNVIDNYLNKKYLNFSFIKKQNNKNYGKNNIYHSKVNNYLKEKRLLNKSSSNQIEFKKLFEILNDKNTSISTNLSFINSKLNSIDELAKQKEKILKYKGGIKNNPELGKEVCNLIINSVKAKLNILKKFE